MKAHEIDYHIYGEEMQYVEVELDPNEGVIAEAGSLMMMETEIDMQTMEARRFPGLYLSGEVLDIDGLTGGFNFQACWTSSWIISESI